MELSPWLDMDIEPVADVMAPLFAQGHRRFIKTHLPLDALPYYEEVSYVVIGRDLRDLALSTHHHARSMNTAGPRAALATPWRNTAARERGRSVFRDEDEGSRDLGLRCRRLRTRELELLSQGHERTVA